MDPPPILEDAYLRKQLDLAAVSKAPLDGRALHARVPSSHWCVTREDLAEFRRLVRRAVESGVVSPTSLDAFDPGDDAVGPSIFTVNEQVIKPVTACFGDPSWALMLHPDGLECDLFLTHCWSEGVFEFIDKVLHSWPRRARFAYCCFLSNPQNLDIGGIVGQPSRSPFALALQSAKCLLVVPNRNHSIYTRIWCVYEAFCAHSQGIPIFTATTPTQGLRRRVLGTAFLGVAACIAALVGRSAFGSFFMEVTVGYVLMVAVGLLIFTSLALDARSSALRWVNDTGAAVCGVLVAFGLQGVGIGVLEVLPTAHVAAFFGLSSFFFAAREADRLHDLQAAQEAQHLLQGYTGKLQDARSSVAADRDRILYEICARQQQAAVEHAIGVLIVAGMSTQSLRLAASRGVDIHGAGRWSLAQVFIIATAFIAHPISHALSGHSCAGALGFVPWLKAVAGVVWLALFRWAGADGRGFAAAVAVKLGVLPYYAAWSAWVGGLVARGAAGPRELRAGLPRRLCVGARDARCLRGGHWALLRRPPLRPALRERAPALAVQASEAAHNKDADAPRRLGGAGTGAQQQMQQRRKQQ